jgi:uncharacterized protein YjiS (DUF1127 family)
MASVDLAQSGLEQSFFSRVFSALGRGLNAYMQRRSRAEVIEQLNAMTDAELAEMGLQRDEIHRYVFRDVLYI